MAKTSPPALRAAPHRELADPDVTDVAIESVVDLSDRFWQWFLSRSPIYATLLGDERYDDRLPDVTDFGRAEERRALRLWRGAADNSVRWIDGTAVYQVGRNSVIQSKKAAASKPGGQTTLDPAANAAMSPEMRPCPWNSGSTFSNRSSGASPKTAPTLYAERHTLACVSGTSFGRDVVPEVNNMNASSVLEADPAPMAVPRVAEQARPNAPAPSPGRGDKSMTGMLRLYATPRLAESMPVHVNSAAIRKAPK